MMQETYFYLYKITNELNGMIYIGAHTTKNLDDGYMGSSKRLKDDIATYGIQYFKKEILEYFDNKDDLMLRESQIVTKDFCKRKDVYNSKPGGFGGFDHLIEHHKENLMVKVKDTGECHWIPRQEYYDNKEKYEIINSLKNHVMVREKDSKQYKRISVEEYHKNKEKYITTGNDFMKGKTIFVDKMGNTFSCHVNDKRVLNGELVPLWTGKKHTEETKKKIGKKNAIHQKGTGNSHYGCCWIYNEELKQSKSIKKEDLSLYEQHGWIKGRKMKF